METAASYLTDDDELCFEQPLTERMRTFLRMEFLYEQARFHMESPADYSARATIASLLEMLAILGRSDVRAEVLKELERQSEIIAHFRRSPGVDRERLDTLIADLDELKTELVRIGSHFLQPLKDSEFLSAIKHRSTIPGGTCSFDVPDYGFWLHLPHGERARQLADWLNLLTPLCSAIAKLLWLAREATQPADCVAQGGFYQSNMERGGQPSLIRVSLPKDSRYFPEISAGRHRFTIRFVEWKGVDSRPVQLSEDVSFRLALS